MPKTLLLADDSVVIQKLVGLSFANEDIELVTTDNGDEAIAKARETRPDAVLADVVMPGLSGYEVCAAIKQDPDLRDTPVLLLTGTFEAFDEERARQVGSDGHITKPFEAQALVERVNELLARDPDQSLATTAPTVAAESFDFFDDDVSDLGSAGTDVTASTHPTTAASAIGDSLAGDDLGFAFGDESNTIEVPEILGEPLDLDAAVSEPGEDHTVAFMPEGTAGPANDTSGQRSATVTSLEFQDADQPPESTLPPITDLDLTTAAEPSPANAPTSPWSATGPGATASPASQSDPEMTVLADDLSGQMPGPRPAAPSLTTIIMSDGDSSRDDISFGEDGAASSEAAIPPPAEPGVASLDDDLFGDTPSFSAAHTPADSTASPATQPPPVPVRDDVFDFDTADSDPVLGSAGDPFGTASTTAPPPAAAGYDVSSSDLGDVFAHSAAPEAAADDPLASPAGGEVSISDNLLDDPMHEIEPFADESQPTPAERAVPPATPGTPDITPVMRQRIHETLERVAWEAFADLSETMVKQVLERVETIAWEVIPQMAETLVKEEIRRMKDEGED